jgi:hypothetical protein
MKDPERLLVRKMTHKASADPAYRSMIDTNPKAAVEQAMSEIFGREMKLSEITTVKVHFEHEGEVHVVLPALETPTLPDLSEDDLTVLHALGSTAIKCDFD